MARPKRLFSAPKILAGILIVLVGTAAFLPYYVQASDVASLKEWQLQVSEKIGADSMKWASIDDRLAQIQKDMTWVRDQLILLVREAHQPPGVNHAE